jgi:nodulation protein E
MDRREVVVTGVGAVSPLGLGAAVLWDGVAQGRNGIDWIQSLGALDPKTIRCAMPAKLRTSTSIAA